MNAENPEAENQKAIRAGERLAGIGAILTGLGSLALLALHPMERANSFAEVVQNEAAGLAQNAIVHGGFLVVLALQLVCYGVFSTKLSRARLASRAGFTFFAVGVAWLSLSMLFDGLVTPAVAARYVAAPDKIESARPLFVFIGAIVGRVMPIGLAFQAAAMLAWSASLFSNKFAISGVAGLALGALLGGAIYLGAFAGMIMAMMGAFLLTALWAVVVGVVLVRGK